MLIIFIITLVLFIIVVILLRLKDNHYLNAKTREVISSSLKEEIEKEKNEFEQKQKRFEQLLKQQKQKLVMDYSKKEPGIKV